MSDDQSDHDHDHPHEPIAGDGLPAAARAQALEELLVEKGVVSRTQVREEIDWLVSRSPADGARLVARAWVDPAFKQRLLANAREAALELGLDPGPSPVVRPWRTPRPCITWSSARSARATRGRSSGRRRTGTRACPTARAPSQTRAGC